MRIVHLADVHAHRDRWPEARASLRTVAEDAKANGADLIAISGDIAHGPLQDSERDIFDELCAEIQALADIAPVAMVYGTPSHDAPGSLEVFERLNCEYGVTILRPGKTYYLGNYGHILDAECVGTETAIALLFGVPEPSKKWLLANGGATGKDDSDQAVRDAMRALLLGLGGMRQEHLDLPCVLLYHGQVSGARTGTGYQAGSGIAVSRDDLAAVGADFYALGDIHEPQRIGDLPAYYPGSVYPLNWGETHKAGCNVVTIDYGRNPTSVIRLDFPHAQRIKIARGWTDDDVLYAEVYEGKQAWLEITASREAAADISVESVLANMLDEGALPGSRVTLNVLPTETVRAGAIIEKKGLRDKVQVWAENSSIPVPESALAKADDLEREAAARGISGGGAHIRIDKLRLRGAIGVWKKSRKDEIVLDLAGMGPGVLALIGANGFGKTTILENLHPWPQMLTRDGALKDHFRLKDSARELWFTDERTGFKYRALISIRADIASGAAEYYLYRDQGAGESPVEGINGRKEPYEAAIGALFGSLELYLRTAFQTQRPAKSAPDLSQATKGERKTLFAELSGIDYLEGYKTTAKVRADELDGSIRTLDATITAAADVDETILRLGREIVTAEAGALAAEGAIKDAAAGGEALAAKRHEAAIRLGELDIRAERVGQAEHELEAVARAIKGAEDSIALFTLAADRGGAAEEELATIARLDEEVRALSDARSAIDAENGASSSAYLADYAIAEGQARGLRTSVEERRRALAKADQALAVARARLAAPVAETCPTCGQTLPADRLEALRHAHAEAEAEIIRLETVQRDAAAVLATTEGMLAAVAYPTEPAAKAFDGAERLAALKRDLDFLNAAAARETIRRADEASVRIEGARKAIAEAEAKRAEFEAELATAAGLSTELAIARQALGDAEIALTAARERYATARGELEGAKSAAKLLTRDLEDARRRASARDEAAAKRDEAAVQRDDWRLLERATGPDGIQALELDALAPSIAAVSNRLLAEAYGSRYQVEFRTTRIAGKGSKVKQVEDFEIYILDTETGDEQTIDSLSGGERVWILKSLSDGFAIIRARNTGTQFLTVMLDEADGALDPEARMLYLRMLEAAHRESGRHQTILVTHARELQAMVERTIDVAELGGAA